MCRLSRSLFQYLASLRGAGRAPPANEVPAHAPNDAEKQCDERMRDKDERVNEVSSGSSEARFDRSESGPYSTSTYNQPNTANPIQEPRRAGMASMAQSRANAKHSSVEPQTRRETSA